MTDLPDAEAAWREWFPVDEKSPRPGEREAFLAGLDAANAEREALKQEVADRVGDLVTLQRHLDAALARNAELESELTTLRVRDEHYEILLADNLALRAELDNLRDRVTALADQMETASEYGTMPGVRMRVRREWAARLRDLISTERRPADPYAEIGEDMREDQRQQYAKRLGFDFKGRPLPSTNPDPPCTKCGHGHMPEDSCHAAIVRGSDDE